MMRPGMPPPPPTGVSSAPTDAPSPWVRRPISVTIYFLLTSLTLAITPVVLPVLALYDLALGRRWASVRVLLFLNAYLVAEVAGIVAATGCWVLGLVPPFSQPRRYLQLHTALQRLWVSFLFAVTRLCWGIEVELRNVDAARTGPYLLFCRHASLADTLLPLMTIGPQGPHLRFITKSQLLWDPCIDIVGNRIPNAFVARGGRDPEGDLARVRALTDDLGAQEAILMFPEGTRFTEEKKARILARFEEKGDVEAANYARALDSTLPPKLAGPLALIEAAPGVDVVFMAHIGTEGSATAAELWRGELIDQKILIEFWRVDASEIPEGTEARERWLLEEWKRVDAWVSEQT